MSFILPAQEFKTMTQQVPFWKPWLDGCKFDTVEYEQKHLALSVSVADGSSKSKKLAEAVNLSSPVSLDSCSLAYTSLWLSSLAVCPTPRTDGCTYFAVGGTLSEQLLFKPAVLPDFAVPTVDQNQSNCVVQIYSTEHSAIELQFSIVLNESSVRDLAWCPFPADFGALRDNHLLGVLAAACGSGAVLFFGVPDPSIVPQKGATIAPTRFERVSADGVLDSAQTLLPSAVRFRDMNTLAVGFVSGEIGLWDLQAVICSVSSSPLNMWCAHHSVVTCLEFTVPYVGGGLKNLPQLAELGSQSRNILVSGGADGSVHVWDCRDAPNIRATVYRARGSINAVKFVYQWNCLFVSDHSGSVKFVSFKEFQKPKAGATASEKGALPTVSVMYSRAAVRSISLCPITLRLASGADDGSVRVADAAKIGEHSRKIDIQTLSQLVASLEALHEYRFVVRTPPVNIAELNRQCTKNGVELFAPGCAVRCLEWISSGADHSVLSVYSNGIISISK